MAKPLPVLSAGGIDQRLGDVNDYRTAIAAQCDSSGEVQDFQQDDDF